MLRLEPVAPRKRGGGNPPSAGGTRRAGAGAGLVPGFTNDEQLALGRVHAQVLADAADDLLTCHDALGAECWASATWGLAYGRELVGKDLEAVLGGGLVRHASHQRSREALALLQCLAVVAPPPYDVDAASAAAALVDQGVIEASWAEGLGASVASGALVVSDPVDDDGISVFLGYEPLPGVAPSARPPSHSLGVYVDHNLGGIAKDAFVGPSLDDVAAASRASPGGPLVVAPVSTTEAAALVRVALDETERAFAPAVTDSFRATRALLLARLRRLPADGAAQRAVRLRPDEQAALLAEFLASREAADLDEACRRELGAFPLRYCSEEVVGAALRFSPAMVERFCTDWAPQQPGMRPAHLVELPDVLRAWIRFVGRRRGIPTARVAEALDAVGTWADGLSDHGPRQPAPSPSPLATPSAGPEVGSAEAEVVPLPAPGEAPAPDRADPLESVEGERRGARGPGGEVVRFPSALDDLERFAEELADAEAEAARELRLLLADEVGRPAPDGLAPAANALRGMLHDGSPLARSIRAAAGLHRLPGRDDRLVARVTVAYLTLLDEPGLDDADLALVVALDHLDWLALTMAAIEEGSPVLDDEWVAATLRETEPELDDASALVAGQAFALVSSTWAVAGVLDADRRLTEVGRWALPRAMSLAWGFDFDSGRATRTS